MTQNLPFKSIRRNKTEPKRSKSGFIHDRTLVKDNQDVKSCRMEGGRFSLGKQTGPRYGSCSDIFKEDTLIKRSRFLDMNMRKIGNKISEMRQRQISNVISITALPSYYRYFLKKVNALAIGVSRVNNSTYYGRWTAWHYYKTTK